MFRIGLGTDIHKLERGKKLILGGIEIPSEFGAIGHSDADALIHALTDAILGAVAAGDIGTHFPDSDPRWKDADSMVFLDRAIEILKEKLYRIVNVDSVITLEKPKLKPFIPQIKSNLARALAIDESCISVKAKTSEGLDSIGAGLAIKVDVIVLLYHAERETEHFE
jgi:2-C-methyl-D-erythritol 2,4-cyclodiphosphate synthase